MFERERKRFFFNQVICYFIPFLGGSLFVFKPRPDETNPVKVKAFTDFNNLLNSMYEIRLNDSEMMKLATLSKLRTEIETRQMDIQNG